MRTKRFKDFNPDLRKIGQYVLCINDIRRARVKNEYYFKKGDYYKVTNFTGDPQGAIEKYGINDYLPVECISTVFIVGEDNKGHEFWIKSQHPSIYNFFKYFEIPEFTENIDKYNL